MKRFFVVFTIFIYVFTSGCNLENSNEKEQVFASTAPQIMFDKIISALDNKDEEELKSLFAVNALNKAQDIEQQSIDIMEFYKGKFISNSSFDTGSSSVPKNMESGFIYLYLQE